VEDLTTIRRACQPIARWWDDYLTTGQADPDGLDDALVEARALGPLTGRLGEALADIIAGCLPDLNYAGASAAFDRVAAIGRGAPLEAVDAIGPVPAAKRRQPAPIPARAPGEQLAFPGITAPLATGRNNGTGTGRS
jgi:hypothetical protein